MDPNADDEIEATTTMARLRDGAGRWLALATAVVLVVPLVAWVGDRVAREREAAEVAAAAPALADAVVLVATQGCEGPGGTGSGFAVELGGRAVVLTNRHVVDDAAGVVLRTLDGGPGPQVREVLLAPDEDVAVLVVDAELDTLGTGGDAAPGDAVRLVGFPGARPVTSAGEVTELRGRRVLLSMEVDGGASGAPVVGADDRVVAQVVARTDDGLGVAIPVGAVLRAAADARPAPGC